MGSRPWARVLAVRAVGSALGAMGLGAQRSHQHGKLVAHALARRLLLHWLCGAVCQLRYSFVWLMSEASLTLAGFNLKGWVEEEKNEDGTTKKKGGPIWCAALLLLARAASHPLAAGSAVCQCLTPGAAAPWRRGLYSNCNWIGVQLSESARALPQSWNTCTGVFLRRRARPTVVLHLLCGCKRRPGMVCCG